MTQPRLELRVYDTLDSLSTLQSAWEQLLSEFPTATTFSSLDWLVPWWRAFGSGQQLKVVAFFDSTWRLVALAPLSVTTHRVASGMKLKFLRLMGDGSQDSDNLDLPVMPGFESAFVDALLDFLASGDIAWDICELNTLPNNSPAAAALMSRLEQRGRRYFTSDRPWLVIDFPPSWETYVNQLTSETRNNLQRYTRRLQRRYQVSIYKCVAERDLERCLEDLFRLHQMRWQLRGESGTFASAERRGFYDDLGRTLLARQRLEFWLLSLDGKTAAAQFCFRYRETVFLLQEGFDPDHAADRVGFVLRGHVLKQLMDAGIERYDFLFGESPGKHIWAPQLQHYRNIHFANSFGRGSMYLSLTNTAREGKKWLRAHIPAGAWASLQGLRSRLGGARRQKPSEQEQRMSWPELWARIFSTQRYERARQTAKGMVKSLVPVRVVQEVRQYRKYKRFERPLYLKIRVLDGLGLSKRTRLKAPASGRAFLFVCFGNMMRSPMCEALMRQELIGCPEVDVTMTSAGLSATPGKPAHPWAIAAAQPFGISLEGHRARLLTAEMVDQADVIFAMDYQNLVELSSRYPSAIKKVFMLSAYAGINYLSVEIRDPFYGTEEETRRCYGILQTCIHNLVSSLASPRLQQAPMPGPPGGPQGG
jgi:protein-tyrosine-phosphatase/CelD/BcsL family acetyltransferase involved in cellulose biosynthesis